MGHLTYLSIVLISFFLPLIWSFNPKVGYLKKWKALAAGILFMMCLLVPWDIWFNSQKIWGFNNDFLLGWRLAGLPIEEYLFFIFIPFACVFIYEAVKYFNPHKSMSATVKLLLTSIGILLILIGLWHWTQWYTVVTFTMTGIFIILQTTIFSSRYLWHFGMSYLIALIPFFLVNGALTGMFTDEPVVWYNDAHHLSIRLLTIPVVDVVYMYLLLGLVVLVFEKMSA